MEPDVRLVVGVALVHRGRLLAARRATPADLAGGWELPGGKVEPGEDPAAAAVREIAEELGCAVEITGWLHGSSPVTSGLHLRVATARLVSGDPVPTEHDAVRWLRVGELEDVRWLTADRPFLPQLREMLSR